MNKISNEQQICASFKKSLVELEHYIGQVRNCFSILPPRSTVLRQIDMLKTNILPPPRELATGINIRYKKYQLKSISTEPRRSYKPRNSTLLKAEKRYQQNIQILNNPEQSGSQKGIARGNFMDRQRLSLEKTESCVHGIPKTQLCALCDPDKFREKTGID